MKKKIIKVEQFKNDIIGTKENIFNPPLRFGTVSIASNIFTLFMSYTYVLSCKMTMSLHLRRLRISINNEKQNKYRALFMKE